MKKFLPYILILVILVGIFSPVVTVYAQGVVGSAPTIANGTPPPQQSSSGWFDPASIFWGLMTVVSNFILEVAAWILWLSGIILDFVLNYTIVDMSAHINGGIGSFSTTPIAPLEGINIAWKIIRDLMNIAFIFILVYEGIKIIIGQSDTSKAKTFISGVVLASLLINFSLFFTKVMIDASNIVTIGLYNSIIVNKVTTVPGQTPTTGPNAASARVLGGLSVPYMDALNLSNIYSPGSFGSVANQKKNVVIFQLMGATLFMIVAFVFFAISIMFVVRFITLVILLMLSPIAYMGMALPAMKGYATQWWQSLNGQLIFAPLYMVMNVIILTLITSPGFILKNGSWGDILTGSAPNTDSLSLIFNFVVIIGLAIASIVVAKSTSTEGSKYIGQMTGNLTKFAGGAVMGGAASISRNTVGRVGNNLMNREGFKNLAFKTDKDGNTVARTGISGLVTRNVIKTADASAKSAFDVRGTSAFGTLAKQAGVDFGKADDPKKVNFQKELENKAKQAADFAKLLKPTEESKFKAKEKLYSTPEYKKLDEDAKKAKGNREAVEKQLMTLNEERVKLDERLKTALPGTEHIIREEIVKKEEEIKVKKAESEGHKKTEEEATKEMATRTAKIDNAGDTRINAYAESFEKTNTAGSYISRYGGAVAKIMGGSIGGGVAGSILSVPGAAAGGVYGASSISPTTRADSREIARKIRKETKEKSDKDKLADLAKKMIETEEKEKKEKEGGEDEKKEEPKPETPKTT